MIIVIIVVNVNIVVVIVGDDIFVVWLFGLVQNVAANEEDGRCGEDEEEEEEETEGISLW